jgi:hypothetical protein
MTPVQKFRLAASEEVLTVNLTQDAPLRGEPKRSGTPHRIRKKMKNNVKFQAKFKF